MLRRWWLIGLVLVIVAPAGLAQTNEGQPEDRGRGGRRARGQDGSQPGERGGREGRPQGRRGRRGPNVGRILDRVAEDLELDESQLAQLEEIKAAQEEAMGQFEQRRAAIREARDAGDEELADRLREEMRAEMEQSGGFRGMMTRTMESLDPILTEDQRTRLAEMRQQFEDRRARGQRRGRMLETLGEDLQLDETQAQQFEEIKAGHEERMQAFRERWQAVRDAREAGNDELAEQLGAELRSDMEEGGGPRESIEQALGQLDPILTEEQRGRLAEIRERNADRGGRGPGRQGDRGQRDRQRGDGQRQGRRDGNPMAGLADELQLDDGQRAQFDEMASANRSQRRERQTEIQALRRSLQEAKTGDDKNAIADIQTQIETLRADGAAADAAFYDQIDGILRADQKQILSDYRANAQAEKEIEDFPTDLRSTIRAAMRVKLDRDQRTQLKKISTDAKKSLSKARKEDRQNRSRDKAAEAALTANVKAGIMTMLTAEQQTKYVEELKRLSEKNGNRARPGNRARNRQTAI